MHGRIAQAFFSILGFQNTIVPALASTVERVGHSSAPLLRQGDNLDAADTRTPRLG